MQWLNHVQPLYNSAQIRSEDNISWSAYHASRECSVVTAKAITSLLPLFRESAHQPAMIEYSMKLVKDLTAYLNPDQTTLLTMAQPLFAIAKQIPWKNPDLYGEGNFLVMMGGLHIEMAFLKCLGDWLAHCGWENMFVEADITSPGKAQAMLKGAHITRTCYAHQVTSCALHVTKMQAYVKYLHQTERTSQMSLQDWTDEQAKDHPQFFFWNMTLMFELLLLDYVPSLRADDFDLYAKVLQKLAPLRFSLDRHNYARWLPVHIRDMLTLSTAHPQIFEQFHAGHFVVKKSERAFSHIALDQNHEQQNAILKGDGGIVGITEDESAPRRWLITSPDISRVVQEYKSSFQDLKYKDIRHHDQVLSVQKTFSSDVSKLVDVIEALGNPFLDDSSDLTVIDTKEVITNAVVAGIKSLYDRGKLQFEEYVNQRLQNCTTPITDTVRKNKIPLFGAISEKTPSKLKNTIETLKSDCHLFSRIFIGCQSRDGNLDDFFSHENQPNPPSLYCMGKLRQGNESDRLSFINTHDTLEKPKVQVKIVDGAALVNIVKPINCQTFGDYFAKIVFPFLKNATGDVERLDVVWDQYFPDSLKNSTREKRGQGVRRTVTVNDALPGNWSTFLRCDQNKSELFYQLAEQIAQVTLPGKVIISTKGEDVVSSSGIDKDGLAPCNHEEADTRVFLHVAHASKTFSKVSVKVGDTDVVVLAVSLFE